MERLADLKKMSYNQYLKSNHWARTRLWRISRANWRCESCGATFKKLSEIEVHHLHYLTIGRESEVDLQVLCQTCHDHA
jgi:5-methylcytosine-specific restriction endonuclease McrA